MYMELTLVIVVAVALFFDFTNGFHDTANAIATVVSTKALKPRIAVIGAVILNFLGAFISIHVAATIATGVIDVSVINLHTVLAGLTGAIVWNLITWRFGIPSSSSHALVGGLAGAGFAAGGLHVVKWSDIYNMILTPSLLSPIIGIIGAGIITLISIKLLSKRLNDTNKNVMRFLQIASGGAVALMHGTNDAQKTMGIITLAIMTVSADQVFHVPTWVIFASASALALGTWTGGWRIINTIGNRITKLEPPQGFAAQTATAITLGVTSHYGLPVSTTHTMSGAIVGTGLAVNRSGINWRIIHQIIVAWLITIPLAGIMGAASEMIATLPHGTGYLTLVTIVIVSTIYFTRNWTRDSLAQVRILLSVLRRRGRDQLL